jgi:hypothetical protein
VAAHDNLGAEQVAAVRSVFPIRPSRESITARAILTCAPVHVRDRRTDPELQYGVLSTNFPATLSIPLLRCGTPARGGRGGMVLLTNVAFSVTNQLRFWQAITLCTTAAASFPACSERTLGSESNYGKRLRDRLLLGLRLE